MIPGIRKGDLVTVILRNGQHWTVPYGVDVEDPMARALISLEKTYDAMAVLLKPRWVPLRLWRFWLKIRR